MRTCFSLRATTIHICIFTAHSKQHKIKYFRVWAEVPSKTVTLPQNDGKISTTTTTSPPTNTEHTNERRKKKIEIWITRYVNSVPFITINLPIYSTQCERCTQVNAFSVATWFFFSFTFTLANILKASFGPKEYSFILFFRERKRKGKSEKEEKRKRERANNRERKRQPFWSIHFQKQKNREEFICGCCCIFVRFVVHVCTMQSDTIDALALHIQSTSYCHTIHCT